MLKSLSLGLLGGWVGLFAQPVLSQSTVVEHHVGHHAQGAAQSQLMAQGVRILHPLVRATIAHQSMTAAYFELINDQDRDVPLVAVYTTGARQAQIHETLEEGGVARMRQREQLLLPAKQSVQLKPGGIHLMLMGLKAPLKAGQSVELVLMYADGSWQKIRALVKKEIKN
jgi:copper(I)-binding protein